MTLATDKNPKNKTLWIALTIILLILIIGLVIFFALRQQNPLAALSATPVTGRNNVSNPDLPQQIARGIRLDPVLFEREDEILVGSYLYEGLVSLDENGEVQPQLAASWIISKDELDYIFALKPNVNFHKDGPPLTADVVLANFNRWFDPKYPLHGDFLYPVWQKEFLGFKGEKQPNEQPLPTFDGIEKVDNLTVLLHLNRPIPDLLQKLALPQFGMVDTTLLAKNIQNYGTTAENSIGTGPYHVSKWDEKRILLQVNPNYHDVIDGPAELEITFKE